jgi:hypothetical protein
MVLSGGSEPPETAAAAAPVAVAVVDCVALVTLAETEVDEVMVDVDDNVVDVAVADDDVDEDSVDSNLIWASLDSASSQLFCLALYMHSTSSSLPPAITTIPSAP